MVIGRGSQYGLWFLVIGGLLCKIQLSQASLTTTKKIAGTSAIRQFAWRMRSGLAGNAVSPRKERAKRLNKGKLKLE
jgi:hypothetical protein